MIGSNELLIGALLLGAILLIVVAFTLRRSKQAQADVSFTEALPDDDPLVDREEFQASSIAEVIEERVRQKAAEEPSLAQFDVDFGTGQGGELEIWVNAERYLSVDDVPHEGLREAIWEAVEEYNKGL